MTRSSFSSASSTTPPPPCGQLSITSQRYFWFIKNELVTQLQIITRTLAAVIRAFVWPTYPGHWTWSLIEIAHSDLQKLFRKQIRSDHLPAIIILLTNIIKELKTELDFQCRLHLPPIASLSDQSYAKVWRQASFLTKDSFRERHSVLANIIHWEEQRQPCLDSKGSCLYSCWIIIYQLREILDVFGQDRSIASAINDVSAGDCKHMRLVLTRGSRLRAIMVPNKLCICPVRVASGQTVPMQSNGQISLTYIRKCLQICFRRDMFIRVDRHLCFFRKKAQCFFFLCV